MFRRCFSTVFLVVVFGSSRAEEPAAPTEVVHLFNGKDLTGLSTWLKASKNADPGKVFSVADGLLHISGDGLGYIRSRRDYRDYHLVVEYKWGKKTNGGKYVRNSGILLNGIGPDGGAGGGAWMASIECQLAQGCVGDLIPIRGKDAAGKAIVVAFKSQTVLGRDRRPRWKPGGEVRVFTNKQLWWNDHDPDFKELLDTRGKNDVESPLGEWTRVECLCRGKRLTIKVNGKTVNEAFDIYPAAGKILLQCEGFELYVRRLDIGPLRKE